MDEMSSSRARQRALGALVGPGILDPLRAGPWKAAGLGLLAAVLAGWLLYLLGRRWR